MTAAILQGVPATTLDTDLWIDLPPRQYIRVLNLCRRLGATVVVALADDTLVNFIRHPFDELIRQLRVALADDTLVNFVYAVGGLGSFGREHKSARQIEWLGRRVRVLPLERIYASKKFLGRPKDLAHLPLLEQALRLRKRTK